MVRETQSKLENVGNKEKYEVGWGKCIQKQEKKTK
jgi:hypothetical protein